jgi:ADP-heptose:LPS heptosyltransferase
VKVTLLKKADVLLGAALLKVLSHPASKPGLSPNSFLFIRPGGIGDAVLLIPTINALKKKYPDAEIIVLAEKRNASAFKLCPHVHRLHLYDKPKELFEAVRGNYDVVIDTEQWHRLAAVVARLTGAPLLIGYATNERKKLFTHTVPYSHDDYESISFMHLLEPLEISDDEYELTPTFLTVPDSAREKARVLLGELADKSFVSIFHGASIAERRWGSDNFSAVAERLFSKGIPVVVLGGKGDEAEGESIVSGNYGLNLAGKTSLVETAAILEKSSTLLSGDSGVLHIGVGLGRPTVSLFGPGIAKKWAPRGKKHVIINKNLPCSPCTKFGYTPKCRINAKCMREIAVDEVAEAVMLLLKSNRKN